MEKFKKIFQNKERRIENLVVFLIILVITLIIINKIIKDDKSESDSFENSVGVELAIFDDNVQDVSDDLEKRLEKILSKIEGVGDVSVLITYSESSSTVPIYNVSSSISTTEEADTSGGTRTIESQDSSKDVVKDSSSNPVTEKSTMPKVEGAIITAKGAKDATTKSNIVSAVGAVTGIATHKIQVFEMGD